MFDRLEGLDFQGCQIVFVWADYLDGYEFAIASKEPFSFKPIEFDRFKNKQEREATAFLSDFSGRRKYMPGWSILILIILILLILFFVSSLE